MKYQIIQALPTDCLVLRRLEGDLFIPQDSANTDYQKYLEWLAAGNEPEVIDVTND